MDVTRRKESEDKATALARRLKATLENITDAFFTLDHTWCFSFLNSEAERLLRRTREDLVGRNVWEEFPEAVGSTFEHKYRQAVAENTSVAFEEYFAPLETWFEVNAYPSEEGLAVYFRNVNDRRRAEAALQETLHREQTARREADFYSAHLKKANDQLAQNAALLNMALRLGKMGAWWIDLHPTPTVHWTPPIYGIFGLPEEYAPDVEDIINRYIPEHRSSIRTAFEACVYDGTPYNLECQIILPDGSLRWTLAIGEAVRNAAGEVVRVQGALQDISELREAAEQSRQLESRLAATLESMTDAFYMLDGEWRFTYLNATAERLLRHKREELLGKNVWESFPRAVGGLLDEQYHRARKVGEPATFEFYYAPLEIFFDVRAFPFQGGLAVYFRDITETKKFEAKLREQAALLDKARDAIFVRDLRDRILYWNAGAARVYGWTAEDVVSSTSERGLYLDDAAFVRATEITLAKGEWTGRFEQRTRDGSPITVEGRWTLVRDEAQEPVSILAIHTDISDRLKLEQQFLRSQRMESIGTLAGGIAHDLNNLLSPIMMGSDLLSERIKDPHALSILEDISKSARRGSELVKQVLSFARGVEGARVVVHMDHLIREISGIVATTFPKNIRFSADIAQDLQPTLGDPTQLNQVLLNLCVNARDAMPEGGRLTIKAANTDIGETFARANDCASGPGILIEVLDEGCGIRKELAERVFEPFFTTKEVGKGTGLGLSTVLGIVRSHGGTVTLYSEEGHGSLFKVYLPAHTGDAADSSISLPPQTKSRGNGEGILLVDDESAILSIATATLEAHGYRVFPAEHGEEALKLFTLHREEIALVLTDMMMPVMDGPALIAALRLQAPDLPVIAASGMNGNGDIDRAEKAGADHFLPKPYTADQLLTALASLLEA